jgi:hypothetical protein
VSKALYSVPIECKSVRIYLYPCNRPWRHIGLWDAEAPTLSRKSAHRWRWGYQPYSLYPSPSKIPGTHLC